MTFGVIFDMDGVLVDSAEAHKQSWELLAKEYGHPMSPGLFRETFGQTSDKILPRVFERELTPEEIRKYGERKEELYRDIVRGEIQPLPGVVPLILGLFQKGWKIGVGSSGPKLNVNLVIEELGIDSMVSARTCSEDVSRGKPHPEVFLTVAEQFGVPPKQCVVVEDSIHGLQAAKNAEMKCIAITTTEPRNNLESADIVIDSFEEISPADVEDLMR